MQHYVKNLPLDQNFSKATNEIVVGAGCFWGVEKKFWDLPGVLMTSVGYSGGEPDNPTYEDVCYKNTNHVEVVKITYDEEITSLKEILKIFWECHDPTQGMRQGNDVGTQYRSAIYCSNEDDLIAAEESKKSYQKTLSENSYPEITTEISLIRNYYFAEEYHQQYLAKNPLGYCGIGGTGCKFEE